MDSSRKTVAMLSRKEMVSFVIPAYKSADILCRNLPGFRTFCDTLDRRFGMIIVDDGSDESGATRRMALENRCVFLENKKNEGKGAATRKGMLAAKGGFIIFTDADIPFENNSIVRFIECLSLEDTELVIGDRRLPESEYYTEISFLRKLSSILFTFIISRYITAGFKDTQCGLKGFKKEIAQDLFSVGRLNGFAFDVELLYIALLRNYRIKRLPVRLRNDEGKSIHLLKHSYTMMREILTLKTNHLRGFYRKKS